MTGDETAGKTPLSGRTIALPASGELDRLAGLLEAAGAETWRCPMVALVDPQDPRAVQAFLDRLVDGGLDDLVFLTGEGVRRLVAQAHAREAAVTAALGRTRLITRGPKPAHALRALGLSPAIEARVPTSQGIVAALRAHSMSGRRVGVQLSGDPPNDILLTFLRDAGAAVFPVSPYVYAPAADDQKVRALIDGLASGRIDAVAFTSSAQVDRLFDVADRLGWRAELLAVLDERLVACIGPIAAEALTDRGVSVRLTVGAPYTIERLASALARSWPRA